MDLINGMTERIKAALDISARENLTEKEFLEAEILEFLLSEKRKVIVDGLNYYEGYQLIDDRERTIIGEGGKVRTVANLPNNRIKNNQYARLVDQKVSYLLSKPWEIKTDKKAYSEALKEVFNRKFRRLMKNIGEDAVTSGIAYLYVYFDQNQLQFKRFKPSEILPFWKDDEHMELDSFVRIYGQEEYVNRSKELKYKVEYYTLDGIQKYDYRDGRLFEDGEKLPYLLVNGQSYQPKRIPLVVFKSNNRETPLISRVKTLQDALNALYSDCLNNLQEDMRNTILVIKNYDGTDLGEFRRNLMHYGAIKIRTTDGVNGGVETLRIEVNAENYKTIEQLLKKALIENGRGLDSRDERLNGNPNQLNIRAMYADLDLDAGAMELEFQASFEDLLYWVNAYLSRQGKTIDTTDVEVIFNKDILINESETIENCAKSEGILSKETIISMHPWTVDTQIELQRIEKEKEEMEQSFLGDYVDHDVLGTESGTDTPTNAQEK